MSKSASVWEKYKYNKSRMVKMIRLSKRIILQISSQEMPVTHNNWKIVNLLKVNTSIAIPSPMHENSLLTTDIEKAEV